MLDGNLDFIKATRNVTIPSHVLYADEIIICCTGKYSNIKALANLLTSYSTTSGQIFSIAKSTIFGGSIPRRKLDKTYRMVGFTKGSFPFIYLSVPIFEGRVKASMLKPLADKIIAKMDSWKGFFTFDG